jgi:hypothetical protein
VWVSSQAETRNSRKVIAAAAFALLIAAQVLALSHDHRVDNSRRFVPQTQTAADADLCGLCLLVYHAPLNAAAPPALERPQAEIITAPLAEIRSFTFGSHPFWLTRAPPYAAA